MPLKSLKNVVNIKKDKRKDFGARFQFFLSVKQAVLALFFLPQKKIAFG